jgi:hypothetical protein
MKEVRILLEKVIIKPFFPNSCKNNFASLYNFNRCEIQFVVQFKLLTYNDYDKDNFIHISHFRLIFRNNLNEILFC